MTAARWAGLAMPLTLLAASLALMTMLTAWGRWERRRQARAAERAARPPVDLADGVIAVALAGACCTAWWSSAGAEHDTACRNAEEWSR